MREAEGVGEGGGRGNVGREGGREGGWAREGESECVSERRRGMEEGETRKEEGKKEEGGGTGREDARGEGVER